MSSRRFVALAGLCGTIVLTGWVANGLVAFDPPRIEKTGTPIEGSRTASVAMAALQLPAMGDDSRAASVPVEALQPPAMGEDGRTASVPAAAPESPPMSDGSRAASVPAAAPEAPPMSDGSRAASVQVAPLQATAMGEDSLPASVPVEALQATATGDDSRAASVQVAALQTTAMGEDGVSVAGMAVDAALPDPRPLLPPKPPLVLFAAVSATDPVENYAKEAVSSLETLDECLVAEICIDQYLWAAYQRTPKVDTVKVLEKIKATVKKKGKMRTVVKTLTKYVTQDFAWKDPAAAQKVGMSMMEYVIGGMDRRFKLKLYYALRALDDAGLMPGITSGFRDDYRQSIASGKKAATERSYHGGSLRGGYGHGLAADLVSVKGATRAERMSSSEKLWKWIDAHGKEFGVGRPYLDRDPPHVGPIDGKEYADKRGGASAKLAKSETKKRHRLAVHDGHGTKGASTVRSPNARTTQSTPSTHSKAAGQRTTSNGPRPSVSATKPKVKGVSFVTPDPAAARHGS